MNPLKKRLWGSICFSLGFVLVSFLLSLELVIWGTKNHSQMTARAGDWVYLWTLHWPGAALWLILDPHANAYFLTFTDILFELVCAFILYAILIYTLLWLIQRSRTGH